jgi:small subunit ribosomal protein S20
MKAKSVKKRERQNIIKRVRNNVIRSKVHTAFKSVVTALDTKDKTITTQNLNKYVSEIDKAIKRGIIHVNKGARLKSRIYRRINKNLNTKDEKKDKVTA